MLFLLVIVHLFLVLQIQPLRFVDCKLFFVPINPCSSSITQYLHSYLHLFKFVRHGMPCPLEPVLEHSDNTLTMLLALQQQEKM